ncbi:amidohydrolase [Amycolatopsis antarctica]|uniref:Amidohydrolase n=1 Tax=Amycolatopsis antarctica TaxID=1854586 RepID=A0A263D627_9PSEU|nr:amidohydrolase family protein [Amycolatopsis antarctica]OZM73037.1 amidohydrolase [Amycolatopsis antarctica]
MTGQVVDAHVRLGTGRETALGTATLMSTMDELGIDRALVAPDERCTAYANDEGNARTAAAASGSDGRLLPYAVASPWRGADALASLERARADGAVALAVDPVLQGFDLLDGLVDPLLRFASAHGWPVYVRTGTPPSALPLPLASLARRWPDIAFLMGRSGATDFWIDAAPALRYARNLYADTCYAPWDTVLAEFARDPEIGTGRVFFSTDAPYTVPAAELRRVLDWPIGDGPRAAVLGGTVLGLLRAAPP